MDNLSGEAGWFAQDEQKNVEDTIVEKKKTAKKRKVKKLDSKKLDDFINEVSKCYSENHDKYLGDLLINLTTSKSSYIKYLKSEKIKN